MLRRYAVFHKNVSTKPKLARYQHIASYSAITYMLTTAASFVVNRKIKKSLYLRKLYELSGATNFISDLKPSYKVSSVLFMINYFQATECLTQWHINTICDMQGKFQQ